MSLVAPVTISAAALSMDAAHAQATRVAQVEVVGNNQINRESILAVVSTRPGDDFSAERLERDRRAIEALGWFKVVGPPATTQVPGGIRVTFVVTEWPVLRQIRINGATVMSEELLRGSVRSRPGQVFNLAQWQADVAAIEDLYKSRNYVAQVLDNLDTPEFAETGVLRAQIMELKIEAVRVTGIRKTKPYVVTRLLKQKEGALYNTAQMAKDYQELRRLDYFDAINSRVDVSQPGQVVVTWELKEKRTGQASVGIGYSPRQSLVGRGEISELNLFGRGQSLSLAGELGTRYGGPSFELSFHEPWLTEDRTSLTVNLYDKVVYRFSQSLGQIVGPTGGDLNNYFERRAGGTVTIGQPLKLPLNVSLRHDRVNTNNLPTTVDFPRQDGNITTVTFRGVRNTRDYAFYPTGGVLQTGSIEPGYASLQPGQLGSFGTSLYTKFHGDMRRYIALKKHQTKKEPERERESQKIPVLAFRIMGGTSVGALPFFEQFFLGGAETMRGYLEDRFWGQNVLFGSVEYRRPFSNRITAVAFTDFGDAWGTLSAFQFNNPQLKTQFTQSASFNPQGSIGLGIRVATPIGPVRLDYGYGLEGGRLHFSIGQSF